MPDQIANQPTKRRRKLSPHEQCEQMGRAGDIAGLRRYLSQNEWSLVDQKHAFRQLRQATEVASRADPVRFSAELFAQVMGFTGYLLLRTHFIIETLIHRNDKVMYSHGPLGLHQEIREVYLPQLIELQRHVAELAESQARTARLWELARLKRRKNQRAEPPEIPVTTPAEQPGAAPVDAARSSSKLGTRPSRNGVRMEAQEVKDGANGRPVERHARSPLAEGPCQADGERAAPAEPGDDFVQDGEGTPGLVGSLSRP